MATSISQAYVLSYTRKMEIGPIVHAGFHEGFLTIYSHFFDTLCPMANQLVAMDNVVC